MTHKDSFDNLWGEFWDDSEKINSDEYIEIGGVAIVIEIKKSIDNLKSKIAFIVENELKDWKNPGQFSIPFGTMKYGEKPLDTAFREVPEELGIELDKSLFNEKGNFIMYVDSKKGKIKVNIYVFHILLYEEPIFQINNKEEIRDILLIEDGDLDKIEENEIRPGTKESLGIINNDNEGFSIYVEKGMYKNTNISV